MLSVHFSYWKAAVRSPCSFMMIKSTSCGKNKAFAESGQSLELSLQCNIPSLSHILEGFSIIDVF